MEKLERLQQIAASCDPDEREAATAAMIELSRIYGEGRDGVGLNLLAALEWAEKAAFLDAPDGYLELSRVIGTACIASEAHELKMEYAAFVVGVCDLNTLRRFGRADIAFNVGSVCEYMERYMDEKAAAQEQAGFNKLAVDYYRAAFDMDALKGDKNIAAALGRTVARSQTESASRPALVSGAYSKHDLQ